MKVSVAPASMSETRGTRVPEMSVSSAPLTVVSAATGASLLPEMVIVAVCSSVPALMASAAAVNGVPAALAVRVMTPLAPAAAVTAGPTVASALILARRASRTWSRVVSALTVTETVLPLTVTR